MDLNFLKGLMSEGEIENNGSSNMILLRTPEGDLTFTFENDDRLEGAFKEWEQLCLLTSEQHQMVLEMMNTCEWDKKVVYENDSLIKIEKYTEEEKAVILAEREVQQAQSFFNHEKSIALKIEEDYRLELEDISEEDMIEVKTYMRAIKPSAVSTLQIRPTIVRPEIMNKYDEVM